MNETEAIEKCRDDSKRFGIDFTLPSHEHEECYLNLLNPFQIYSSKDEDIIWRDDVFDDVWTMACSRQECAAGMCTSGRCIDNDNQEDRNLIDYSYVEGCRDIIFYKIFHEQMNFTDAKARCESDGTFLTIPRSKTENDFFADLIISDETDDTDTDMWIGIHDFIQEGTFVAVNGQAISYTNWYPSEPNDQGGEDAVELRLRDNGRWNDVAKSEKRKFICSINLKGNNSSPEWNLKSVEITFFTCELKSLKSRIMIHSIQRSLIRLQKPAIEETFVIPWQCVLIFVMIRVHRILKKNAG